MAEVERTEHGDSGRARAWTLRAVRALHSAFELGADQVEAEHPFGATA